MLLMQSQQEKKQVCPCIVSYIKGHSLTLSRDRRQFIELDKDNIKVETFDNAKRQVPGKKSGVSKDTFRDLRSTFTEEQIKTEAARCLGCGASVVDPISVSDVVCVPYSVSLMQST